MTIRGRKILSLGPIFLPLITACEKPFEPIQPNDLAFSIYGHLEATADTQWVRVTPIRTSIITEPGDVDALVTLEELETGLSVVMNDSLTRYVAPNFPDSQIFLHNFSTTMPMVPGRHYRLTATRSDGASASATVLIPVIEDPVAEVSFRSTTSAIPSLPELAFRGTQYLAMVRSSEEIRSCNLFGVHREWLLTRPAAAAGEPHMVNLEWPEDRPWWVGQRPPPPCVLGTRWISVIASGEEWAYAGRPITREQVYPELISTVEGRGVGFLGGVQTYVFTYERCVPLEANSRCTITYSQRSATFVGIGTDSCTGGPLMGAAVTLLGGTGGRRTTTTDASGSFRFRGLDPGVPYSITVTQLEFEAHSWTSLILAEAATDTASFSYGCG